MRIGRGYFHHVSETDHDTRYVTIFDSDYWPHVFKLASMVFDGYERGQAIEFLADYGVVSVIVPKNRGKDEMQLLDWLDAHGFQPEQKAWVWDLYNGNGVCVGIDDPNVIVWALDDSGECAWEARFGNVPSRIIIAAIEAAIMKGTT